MTDGETHFLNMMHRLHRELANAKPWLNYTTRQNAPLPQYDLTKNPGLFISIHFLRKSGLLLARDAWENSSEALELPWVARIPTSSVQLHEPMLNLWQAGVYCLVTSPDRFWVQGQIDPNDRQPMTNKAYFRTEADMVLGVAMFEQYK